MRLRAGCADQGRATLFKGNLIETNNSTRLTICRRYPLLTRCWIFVPQL